MCTLFCCIGIPQDTYSRYLSKFSKIIISNPSKFPSSMEDRYPFTKGKNTQQLSLKVCLKIHKNVIIKKTAWAYMLRGAYLQRSYAYMRNAIFLEAWLQKYFCSPLTKFYVRETTNICAFSREFLLAKPSHLTDQALLICSFL